MEHPSVFDWVGFPEGQARFSGGIRGGDERGHDTVAVSLGKNVYYGEIKRRFLKNGNDFDVEVVSFGYLDRGDVGDAPFDPRETLSRAEIEATQALILQLVKAGTSSKEKPRILAEYPDAHFMGKVLFREGWARIAPLENGDA